MKTITDYIELHSGDEKRVKDYISDKPINEKQVILDYLKAGQDAGVRCSSIYDYIENRSMLNTIHRYTDGEYIWDDEEILHFVKYNLKLDDRFVKHVIDSKA